MRVKPPIGGDKDCAHVWLRTGETLAGTDWWKEDCQKCKAQRITQDTIRSIYHYYHLYAVDGWLPIVEEHFKALETSGLLAQLAASPFIGLVGDQKHRMQVIEWLSDNRVSATITAVQDKGFEQVTLKRLWKHGNSCIDNEVVLYAHTKGVAHPSVRQDDWRKRMTDLLVGNWEQCVDLLNQADIVGAYRIVNDGVAQAAFGDGADIVAAQLNEALGTQLDVTPAFPQLGESIFAGNFWWTNMYWVSNLPEPETRSRYDAETWVGHRSRFGKMPRVQNIASAQGVKWEILREKGLG